MNPSPLSMPDASPFFDPLDRFYQRARQALPDIDLIEGDQVPHPYRELLVHQNDMTPTLEAYHQEDIRIQLFHSESDRDVYLREVVLKLEKTRKTVEFGAIRIRLDLLTPDAKTAVLEEHFPLGHILHEYKVPHRSNPKAFMRVVSDPLISEALNCETGKTLYGRLNALHDQKGEIIADVAELLPPI